MYKEFCIWKIYIHLSLYVPDAGENFKHVWTDSIISRPQQSQLGRVESSRTELTASPALVPRCCRLIYLHPELNVDPVPILLLLSVFTCVVHLNILFWPCLDSLSNQWVQDIKNKHLWSGQYIYFSLKNGVPPLLLLPLLRHPFLA